MIDELMPLIKQFVPFAQEWMGFKNPPKLFLKNDPENAKNPLGKTAYYDPNEQAITLYISGRHPKDILRSLGHELVHHKQNCDGKFKDCGEVGANYAQTNPHLRAMEFEANKYGATCLRDFEDGLRERQTIYYEYLQKGVTSNMSTKNWKNKEMGTLISESWGFGFDLDALKDNTNDANVLNEGSTEAYKRDVPKNTGMTGVKGDDKGRTYMGHEKVKKEEVEDVEEASTYGKGKGDIPTSQRKKKTRSHKPGPATRQDVTSRKGFKGMDYQRNEEVELEEDLQEKAAFKRGDETEQGGAAFKGETEASRKRKGRLKEDSGEEEAWHQWKNEHADDDHIREMEHHLRALKEDRDYERHGAEDDHDHYEDEGDPSLDERRKDSQRTQGRVQNNDRRLKDTSSGLKVNEGVIEQMIRDILRKGNQ